MQTILAGVLVLLFGIELTDEESSRVEDYRKSAMAALSAEIKGLQKEIQSATKARDQVKAGALKDRLGNRKRKLNETRQAPADRLFLEMRAIEQAQTATEFRAEQKQQREKELAAAGPVSILGMGINTNVIGLPEITIEVRNNTEATVEAIEFDADCFNKFDEPVKKPGGTNRYNGHWKYAIAPGAKERMSGQMSLHGTTAKADVWISRVRLSNGEVWTQTKEQATKKPYGLAKARLME